MLDESIPLVDGNVIIGTTLGAAANTTDNNPNSSNDTCTNKRDYSTKYGANADVKSKSNNRDAAI